MGVNVGPGVGEGGIVEIRGLVPVNVGSLAGPEVVGVGELVSGGWEGEKESGGLEMLGDGKDELGSTVSKLGVGEGGDAEGEEESGGLEDEMSEGGKDEN